MSSSAPLMRAETSSNPSKTRRSTVTADLQSLKQTFRKPPVPKTAAERAMFRQNATESPLLRLPSEIRTRIWRFVLGDRMVHFKWIPVNDWYPSGSKGKDSWPLQGRECGCPFTEKQIYDNYMICLKALRKVNEELKMVQEETVPDGTEAFELDFSTLANPDVLESFDFDSFLNQSGPGAYNNEDFDAYGVTASFYDGRWFADYTHLDHDRETLYDGFSLPPGLDALDLKHRKSVLLDALRCNPHAACSRIRLGVSRRLLPQPSLRLMQVCRQIYSETHAVFWGTNTFSFDSLGNLQAFMTLQSAYTRGLITKMHLDFGPQGFHPGWVETSFKTKLVSSLRGLRELHLYVTDERGQHSNLAEFFLDHLQPFRKLNVKVATMIIADPWAPRERIAAGQVDESVEVIETVLRALINPAFAEVH